MSALTQNLVDVGFNVRRADAIGTEIESAVASVSVVNPVGAVIDYAGATAPSGWLLCFGQAISRTTYAELFAVLGTTYGTGDGSTTFNIPDLRGRVIAGQDDMGGSSANRLTNQTGGLDGDTLGATGGSETHTITEAQLAAHTHTFSATTGSDGAHQHHAANNDSTTDTLDATDTIATTRAAGDNSSYVLSGNTTTADRGLTDSAGAHTHAVSGTSGSTGSGTAHNNVQPTIILNKIIFTNV
jgi:microcystin-dependent protein